MIRATISTAIGSGHLTDFGTCNLSLRTLLCLKWRMMLSLMIGINAQQVTILREVVIVRGKIVMQVVDA